MKKLATSTLQIVCAMLVFTDVAHAQASTPPRAAPNLRSGLARQIRDSISFVLRAALDDRAFPGAYAVVGDSRGILAEFSVGHLDWSKSPRPDRHTLWDLASLTKVLGTTTALAQLIEGGKVELNAPVQRYVPDWIGAGKESVTVRHLLTHTSGLPSFRPYDQQTHNADTLAAMIFNTALERSPGDSMVYSDMGAFMMGRVIENVSGQRLDKYLAMHVFRPLRMNETMFNPPRSLRARVAPTEFDSTRGGLVRGKVHDERAYYLGGVAAHAGLFSSAADVSRFGSMLLHHGMLEGKRILRAETLEQFTAYADSGRSNRALGWEKPPAAWAGGASQGPPSLMSSRAFGHTGFTGTSIAIDPELDLYIILLSNRVNPTRNNPKISAVRRRLADAVVSVVRTRRGPTLNAEHP